MERSLRGVKMKSKFIFSILVVVFVLTLIPAQELYAQTGYIWGRVIDVDGNPIPGVTVRFQSLKSNRKYTLATDEDGAYQHAGVYSIDTYRVIVEKDGYVNDFAEGIKPGANGSDVKCRSDFIMKKGAKRKLAYEMSDDELDAAREKQKEQKKKIAELEAVRGSFEEAVALYNSGQYELAIEGLKKVLEVDREQPSVWGNLAAAYAKMEQYDLALENYTTALTMQPENAAFYQNMGSIYAAKGNAEKARELYEKAASLSKDLSPKDAAANYYNMGVTYINAGKNEEAMEALKKAIDVDPTHGESHYQMGVVLLGTGDLEGAIDIWKKYLEISPDGPNAPTATELIKSLSGN